MTKLTAKILDIDTPGKYSGHIFSKEEVEHAVKEFKNKLKDDQPVFGKFGLKNDIDCVEPAFMMHATHIVKDLKIDGPELYADIEALPTQEGKKLEKIIDNLEDNYSFATSGYGEVENGVVKNFTLESIDIFPKI